MKNIQSLQRAAYVGGFFACVATPFVGIYAPLVPSEVVLGLGLSGLLGLWAGFVPYTARPIQG